MAAEGINPLKEEKGNEGRVIQRNGGDSCLFGCD